MAAKEAWGEIHQFYKIADKKSLHFLAAPLSGILPFACLLTGQNIPDNSCTIHQFY
jgi:hypothetical protein